MNMIANWQNRILYQQFRLLISVCYLITQQKGCQLVNRILYQQFRLLISLYYCQQNQKVQHTSPTIMAFCPLKSQSIFIKNIVITLRKLIVRDNELNNMKIMVSIVTNGKQNQSIQNKDGIKNTYEITQSKKIKNGIVCFYGESIILNQKIKKFIIIIYQDLLQIPTNTRKQIVRFYVGNNKIKQFSQRKSIITSQSEFIDLIWEAHIQSQNPNVNLEDYEDQSMEDFDDIQIVTKNKNLIQHQLLGRKSYSPIFQPKTRYRSHTLKRNDSKSQLISQPFQKLTQDTNQTVIIKQSTVVNNKTIKNKKQNITIQQIRKAIQRQQDLNMSFSQQQENQEQLKTQQKQQQTQVFYHPILTPHKPPKIVTDSYISNKNTMKLSYMSPNSKPQTNNNAVKKKTDKFYDRISIKSIVYTSMIGIIGGFTAAQL